MGAGTTSMAVFYEGATVYADVIPVGGGHVTRDIARGLSTPPQQAERLKTLYGSALRTANDDHEMIDVPALGEEKRNAAQPGAAQLPKFDHCSQARGKPSSLSVNGWKNPALPALPVNGSSSSVEPRNCRARSSSPRKSLRSRCASAARFASPDWPKPPADRPSQPAQACLPSSSTTGEKPGGQRRRNHPQTVVFSQKWEVGSVKTF